MKQPCEESVSSAGEPVTICVFAYNEERTIAATLQSISEQSYSPIVRILVGANGCQDRTVDIAQRFAEQDPRCEVLDLSERGKARTWNVLFRLADTPVVVFVDGDQLLDRCAVAKLAEAFVAHPSAALVGASAEEIYVPGRYLSWLFSAPADHQRTSLSGKLYAAHRARLERALIKAGYDGMPKRIMSDDLFLSAVASSNGLVHEREALAYGAMPKMRDRIRKEVRCHVALLQLTREFLELRARVDELEAQKSESQSKFAKLKQVEGWGKRIVLVLSYPCRRLVLPVAYALIRRRAVRIYGTSSLDAAWLRCESDKVTPLKLDGDTGGECY